MEMTTPVSDRPVYCKRVASTRYETDSDREIKILMGTAHVVFRSERVY